LFPTLGGRSRVISEFETSLVYTELQDNQSYTEKPCLGKKKKKSNHTKKPPTALIPALWKQVDLWSTK
jgi:hypothetical protein